MLISIESPRRSIVSIVTVQYCNGWIKRPERAADIVACVGNGDILFNSNIVAYHVD